MKSTLMKTAMMTAGVATLFGQSAHAGELKFDFMSNWVNTSYNEAAATPNNNSIKIDRVRLDAKGKLGELTSYRARLNLLKANDSTYKRDESSGFIDIAVLSRKLTEELNLNVGKMITGVSGFEGQVSLADLWLPTQATADILNSSTSASQLYYVTGVGLTYTVGDHNLTAMIGNPGRDEVTSGSAINQDRNAWGVVYNGKFFEGMFNPVVSYFVDDQGLVAGTDRKPKNTFVGAGGKVTTETFDVEGDVLMNTYKDRTTASQDDKVTSYYLLARYKINGFAPHVKYEISQRSTNTAGVETKTDYKGLTTAVEYTPIADETFRYHVAYTDLSWKADTTGAQDLRKSELKVGVRMLADILK